MKKARWEWVVISLFAASAVMAQTNEPGVVGGAGGSQPGASAEQKQDECFKQAMAREVSPQDMVKESTAIRDQMGSVLSRILELRKLAIQNSDGRRLQCADKAKIDLDATIEIVDSARIRLQEAVVGGTKDDQKLQAAKISCAQNDAQSIGAAAEICSGTESAYVGDTLVTVTVSGNLTQEDITKIRERVLEYQRAPESSPFSANFNL